MKYSLFALLVCLQVSAVKLKIEDRGCCYKTLRQLKTHEKKVKNYSDTLSTAQENLMFIIGAHGAYGMVNSSNSNPDIIDYIVLTSGLFFCSGFGIVTGTKYLLDSYHKKVESTLGKY